MGYIITAIISIVSGVLVFLLQQQIKENRDLKKAQEAREKARETALETGVRQLLSVRLEEMYDRYADLNTIPLRAYRRWKKLHKAYKGLNGNGTFDHMDAEVDEKHLASDQKG